MTPEQTMSVHVLMPTVMSFVATTLPADRALWVQEHIRGGAPGLSAFARSEAVKPVMDLLLDTYKDFLEGRVK